MKKTYLMGDIAKELKINKTKVFRCIKELELEALNENTREYSNSSKEYSEESKNLIIANLTKKEKRTKFQNGALQKHYRALQSVTVTQECDNREDRGGEKEKRYRALLKRYSNDSEKIIELLESQLQAKDKELDRAYQEKQDLIRLLDQQQRLSLQANQKIEILENKEETKEEIKDDEKKNWWQFWK